jgi:hypothetical protein
MEGDLKVEGESDAGEAARSYHVQLWNSRSLSIAPSAVASSLHDETTAENEPGNGSHLFLLSSWRSPLVQWRAGDAKLSLAGRCELDLFRIEPVAFVPAQAGQHLQHDNMRLDILDAQVQRNGGLRLRVSGEYAFPFQGMLEREHYDVDDHGWAIIDTVSHRLHVVSQPPVEGERLLFQRRMIRPEVWYVIPSDNEELHPEAMKLVLFRRVYIGTAEVPFTYEDQVLKVE